MRTLRRRVMLTESTQPRRAAEPTTDRAWEEVYRRLSGTDPARLSPEELDDLGESAWWLCHTEEALEIKQRAYVGHVERGSDSAAAMTAWWLSYGHLYWGQRSQASGWLRRMRRHVEAKPEEGVEAAYLSFAVADAALQRGDLDEAESEAGRAVGLGQRLDCPDAVAMGLQVQGRTLGKRGRVAEGFDLLDEAMTFVVAEQISDLLVGSVYCSVIHTCRDFADLERAVEWTESMRSWYEALPTTTPYHGLCRVYRGEVLGLRGMWSQAETELRDASDVLLRLRPRAAAEALYALGELSVRRGELADAERSFTRSQELGRDPQPGRALLLLAQGRSDEAHDVLQTSLAQPPRDAFLLARLLGVQVEVAISNGEVEAARDAAAGLRVIAGELGGKALDAAASFAGGLVQVASGDLHAGAALLRHSSVVWSELGVPYEEGRARRFLGETLMRVGDDGGGTAELEAARVLFRRVGALRELHQVGKMLGEFPSGLTAREVEVLRLVAAGMTNREIGRTLVISEHTVRRHIQNIFSKIGVSSRTAATAYAFQHGLT